MTSKLTRDELNEVVSTYGKSHIAHRMAVELLAAMDSEPVAWLAIYHGEVYDEAIGITRSVVEAQADHFGWESALTEIIPLYRHAQQPVVPENRVTAEHRRVIEMLLSVCGAAFELADDSCQQDVDGEDCHVVPNDAFQRLSNALDEIENTLPTEDIDRPDVFLAWSAMPRAALKSLLQAGNSPVIPDGYVMVPKEPTEDMIVAGFESEPDEVFSDPEIWEEYQEMSGCQQAAHRARLCWAAMLAVAPPAPNSTVK
ncbi:hypothetical protein [Klebsiella pneumoniae]|uniref:hypothetical protein n=1 Tax=Klebsiella pneumoniae TaxID=573 RepID=UPI002D78090D|nr:hypothetical protein [Klebsiella pneumoniae]WRP77204.1 hypothetical protein VI616_12100 [Klebsiella pneumoniae]